MHGWSTHLDALGHIYTDDVGYNGRRRTEIFTSHGLVANAITALKYGVFTRGVLLDVADSRGLRWLPAEHVALFGGDCVERLPGDDPDLPVPLRQLGVGAMGLTLLDWPDLDGVRRWCAELHRRTFLLTVAPLPIIGGTGSPVNPIATF